MAEDCQEKTSWDFFSCFSILKVNKKRITVGVVLSASVRRGGCKNAVKKGWLPNFRVRQKLYNGKLLYDYQYFANNQPYYIT
jgi:hypothetical protein